MTRKAKPVPCPVCGRSFKNKGGLNSHLRLTKDTDHQAHRHGKPRPTEPLPQADPEPVVQGLQDPKVPDTQAPSRGPSPEPVAQQEAEGPLMVAFRPPADLQPLLPPDAKPPQPPKALDVPLAPIINGGVAVMANGFILRGDKDGELTVQEVQATGFGESAEAALKHYFPDLKWDHPLVAVFVSGAGLAACIASKKAPKEDPKGQRVNQASEEAAASEVEEASEPLVGQVDPYWAAIQAQAGGGA